ncbi:hypothetical protein RclHR1_07530010 [Rhizophagus clarus]|uniref:Kinase-like domain-containing protein n=1 Tax=Rhizophagus clarus TaxID=94130 RepID=A0A2Z6RZ57_9GLOM|nr:hypothetical protein RclHR1_07530010 [Rhizophagus clarus]GES90951.1 kinase-like domain-containing protein [Rhizophagus clarus]
MEINKENELVNWIEDAISKKLIKYYDYKHFNDIQDIGSGGFGQVSRAKWKNTDQYFALKSFFNLNNITIKEIVHEFKLQREVDFHDNIIRFYGITKFISENKKVKDYLLVLEYANQGNLRNYLKYNFDNLTWNDKYNLAYQIACAVLCLHDEGILHNDLNSANILIHRDVIKLADFGLSKRINESSRLHKLFGVIPYIDPKKFSSNRAQVYKLNEKSDVYSLGILLWEISSGQSPFSSEPYDLTLALEISKGLREEIVPGTPPNYAKLYTDCWNGEPYYRPTTSEVVTRLKDIISEKARSPPKLNVIPSDSSQHGDLSKLIEKFNNMSTHELEQLDSNTIKSLSIYYSMNISEVITSNEKELSRNVDTSNEKDLSRNVDEIVKFYLKLLNKGKNSSIRKQHVLEYLENNKITKEEIYNWLLNNQNNSNDIFLLGYFNFIGIIKPKNFEFAFYLFMNAKASKQKHTLALYYIGACYLYGLGIIKDEKLAFKYYQIIADENHAIGQTKIGYFYENGIGVDKNDKMAVHWYRKGDSNGNYLATFDLAQCFRHGIGVDINYEKAFDLYQKAANFIPMAQYGLGEMYENGDGIVKNIDQAINWYTKSFEQGYQKAQVRLKILSRIKKRKRSDTCKIN